jgi:poly-beta-hydroxybutyrate-responsive repressor
MPRGACRQGRGRGPQGGGFGNIPRFIEPVVLLLLKQLGCAHGYQLASELPEHSLTGAMVDRGALYRTLRQLEIDGHVTSDWDVSGHGPAKRLYRLTPGGEEFLQQWTQLIEKIAGAMSDFVVKVRDLDRKETKK